MGWRRFANGLLPADVSGKFRVENRSTWIEGDLSSYLEREIYLYGGHEDLLIEKFLGLAAGSERKIALDIGANIGQHSIIFSEAFDQVHSFEPNPKLWPKFEKNVSLNPNRKISLHKFGLANEKAEIPFYNIDNGNEGLGTFSNIEQYDQPLNRTDTLKVVRGDDFLHEIDVEKVDAIKIDVQGLEGEVLLGLRETIRRSQPVIWLELGAATKMDLSSFESVQRFFPYPVRVFYLDHSVKMMIRGITLTEIKAAELPIGDYIICPQIEA
jgi:FkbM family methyltransferase